MIVGISKGLTYFDLSGNSAPYQVDHGESVSIEKSFDHLSSIGDIQNLTSYLRSPTDIFTAHMFLCFKHIY